MQETNDRVRKVKSILVTLPKPETEKSPYFDLAKKYNVKIDFRSFIHVEGVPARDFRKDKINLADFTA
ncbi:MAG: uroporphyrinogen-III synthase, partial [Pedobacter sp.]